MEAYSKHHQGRMHACAPQLCFTTTAAHTAPQDHAGPLNLTVTAEHAPPIQNPDSGVSCSPFCCCCCQLQLLLLLLRVLQPVWE